MSRLIHIDFTREEISFDAPGISVDPDGDGYAQNGPGICIQSNLVEIALTWNQGEALYLALQKFFTPEDLEIP